MFTCEENIGCVSMRAVSEGISQPLLNHGRLLPQLVHNFILGWIDMASHGAVWSEL